MILTKEVTMNLHYRGNPIVVDALQGDSARALVIHFMAGMCPGPFPRIRTFFCNTAARTAPGESTIPFPMTPAHILLTGTH